MPVERLTEVVLGELKELQQRGTLKGREEVIAEVIAPADGRGPRYRLQDGGDREFLRMNSNGYLGMSLRAEVIAAEEQASRRYGTGPGAVRFISGTYAPHLELERHLAAFHGRDGCMIFSSAYATTMGVLP